MERIPAQWRSLPVYITEINHIHRRGGEHELGWINENIGFVREIYEEIDRWNKLPYAQQIRCGLIYRWTGDRWAIADKSEVQADFRSALDFDRRWRISSTGAAFSFNPGLEKPGTEIAPSEKEERCLVKPDDLTRILGLGSKSIGILNAAGIYIFEQLAETTPERLMAIVGESELRARYLRTWPEQAALAVAGDWDGLADYKAHIH
jgi:hypothetical protein